jgi:cell division protein ZapA
MLRSVTVDVMGQRFTLKTDADEAYVRSLARLVSDKIAEAKTGGRTFSTHALAIRAAMNIADDLLTLKRRVRDKSRKILSLLDKGDRFLPDS